MPKLAANLTMLFNEIDFLDRFAAAAKAGFEGVEYLFPYDYDKNLLREHLQENRLTQVLHNLPAGNWAAGERGIGCHPDRISEFEAGVDKAIEYATALGCKQVNCLAGVRPSGLDPVDARETFVKNLQFAATRLQGRRHQAADRSDQHARHPGILSVQYAAGGRHHQGGRLRNLFVQYDIYHMQIMEGDLAPTIEKHLKLIPHMQLADTPGRHEPGTGEINYDFLLPHIDKLGYEGWIGCEYKPAGKTVDGLGWTKPYLR
jgi:hydroxypyruvate isomerase